MPEAVLAPGACIGKQHEWSRFTKYQEIALDPHARQGKERTQGQFLVKKTK